MQMKKIPITLIPKIFIRVGCTLLSKMIKSKSSNALLLKQIELLKKKSYEEKAPIWRALAESLSKARARRAEVNIGEIAKHTKKNDTVAVPGKILGAGEINHKVTAAAMGFSSKAAEKITKAGGKCLSLEELIKKNPRGSRVKIMR
jgi:large subunit ribosomal protein L18e